MAARTIEARLVISGEDKGASAAIANVVKAVKAMDEVAKVSKPLQEVGRSLQQVEQQSRAVEAALKARGGAAEAEARLKAMAGAASAAARALADAKVARAAFDGVKAAAGSEQARQVEAATKAVREASAAYRRAEGDVRRATAAVAAQTATMQYADAAAKALGADLGALEAHQQRLRASYDAGTAAITRQIAAEERAAKVGATMGVGGRVQLDRIESGRRVAEGMSAPGRAAAAAQASTARQAAEEIAALRSVRIEAAKALASGAGIYVGHKAGEARKEVTHTYAEFDDLIRYQTKVADLTPAERKSRMAQAVHLGGQTSFNDIQVLETQLTLAQRGVKKEFVEPFTQEIVNYAQAMNTTLPEAAKTLEGVIFSTNQNVENANSALAVMRKNVDMMVKTAKVGGLGDQDLKEAFKFGGASGTGAGLSPQTMGTIFATLHRVGYAGSEAGVATRAIAARLVSPTAKGRDALDAMGVDPNKFSTMPDAMSGKGLASMSRRTFGKDLSADQMSRIQAAMDDKTFTDEEGKERSIVEDQGQFAAALAPILLEGFAKNEKGEYAVKDQKDVAKMIGRFHKMSVESVDSEGLLKAILEKNPTMAQANALFSEKHGGKVVAIARKIEVFNEIMEAIQHVPEGFAKGIGDYRMGGFSGAMKRLKNTRLNMETAAGRALDDDGEGSGGAITKFVRTLADIQQHIAELDPKLVAAGSAIGYFGGKMVEVAGTVGLMGSALALTKSAFALDAAAIKLGAAGGPPGGAKDLVKAVPLVGFGLGGVVVGLGAGAVLAGAAAADQIPKIAEKEGPTAIDPATGEKIDTEIPNTTPWLRDWWNGRSSAASVPSMTLAPGAMPLTIQGTGLSGFGLSGPVNPEIAGKEAGEKVGGGVAEGLKAKGAEVVDQAQSLFDRLQAIFKPGIVVPLQMSFEGAGMGGGSGIQTASFGGGGGLGGLIHRASLGGGGIDSGGGAVGDGSGRTVPRGAFSIGTGAGDSWQEAVMRAEGTAGKDPYNVVLGNGRYGLPSKPLTDMTLAEAYRFGRTVRARHGSSSAIGAFQIVGRTMKEYMGEAGLGWDDKFNPENQRKLADVIRRRQGFGAWEGFKVHRGELGNARRLGAYKTTPDDPRLVKGLDGKEGLDLGNGTMKMPDGSIRPLPTKSGLTIPEAPEGGFGGGRRGDLNSAADRMHAAAEKLENANFHGRVDVRLQGGGGRVTGMRAKGKGMSADMGVSMPGAKESDDDWL